MKYAGSGPEKAYMERAVSIFWQICAVGVVLIAIVFLVEIIKSVREVRRQNERLPSPKLQYRKAEPIARSSDGRSPTGPTLPLKDPQQEVEIANALSRLQRMALGDESKVRSLISLEQERLPSGDLLQWVNNAIERWVDELSRSG